MALSKTGRFLSKAEILGVGVFSPLSKSRRNPKGDGGKGTEKKMSRQFATNVTTVYDMSRQFATFYDNFRLFIPLT